MNDKMSTAVCFSHIGKRLNHEDNFLINGVYLTSDKQKRMSDNRCYFTSDSSSRRTYLFAVSDGMGGHNAGEVASRICVEKLASAEKELYRYSTINEVVDYLQMIIAEINSEVYALSCKNDELKGMGATVVILVICGNDVAVLSVGDSRAYYFDGDALVQITKDHTEGQRMLDLGLLTRKELSGFSARKNLNRYIGFDPNRFVFRADEFYPVLENGILLLCSDGISDFLPDNRISEILCSEDELKFIAKKLVNEAVLAHNADNATAILVALRR